MNTYKLYPMNAIKQEINALHKDVKDMSSSLEWTNSVAMIALTGSAVASSVAFAASVGTRFSIGIATGIIASIVCLTAIPSDIKIELI